ncbi:MAG: protein-methionine-sulfoxide reductase heme-binding subunit MsrQ [Pseudomonadota bacterium]
MSSAAMTVNGWLRKVPVWPWYVLFFLPAIWWFCLALMDRLGPEPEKKLEHLYGMTALQLLIASLCVTPLLRMTRINLMRFRRMLGLMGFYYVLLHFLVYAVLIVQLDVDELVRDVTKRPYIIVGTASMLLLVPLAVTSTNGAIRRLGTTLWNRIHWLAYPAVVFAILHYLWLVKTIHLEVLIYAAIVAFLIGYRVWRWAGSHMRARRASA